MGALKSPKCSKGHKLSGNNLYMRKNGNRECRKCSIARAAAQSAAKRKTLTLSKAS